MGILENIINRLKPASTDSESNSGTTSEEQASEATSAPSSGAAQAGAMARDLSAEQAQQAYVDKLKGKEDLSLQESLTLGLEETGLVGVTKEKAQELQRLQTAAQALEADNISLTEIQPHEQEIEIGAPSEGKAVGFEPDRGKAPSFPKKNT
jgi:hypothetical protein